MLNNQSNSLSGRGRREQALAAIDEAVTIHRQLAEALPPVFAPRLASSLNDMADILETMDRQSDADAARAEAAKLA